MTPVISPPEFSRRVAIGVIGAGGHKTGIAASADECAALAGRFGWSRIESLTANANLLARAGGVDALGTLNAVIKRMNEGDQPRWIDPKDGRPVVGHGFRSTFRDWVSETTNFPRDVAEMALAHAIGDKVEAAYRRGELFTSCAPARKSSRLRRHEQKRRRSGPAVKRAGSCKSSDRP